MIKKFNQMFENTNHDEIKFKFDLCIDGNNIIDYIEHKTGWEWDDICDMEKEYKDDYKNSIDHPDAYWIVNLGEKDDTTFQYWLEQFLKDYSEEIGDKSVCIINND